MSAAFFGPRLRELREEAGLTQEQLAERAGVKRDAVARWERNNREPSWGNVLALAQALGVECSAFTTAPATTTPAPRGRPRKGGGAPPEPMAPAPPAAKPKRRKPKGGPSTN
jgi:transcriptional regulator with XRE-family HTH domain